MRGGEVRRKCRQPRDGKQITALTAVSLPGIEIRRRNLCRRPKRKRRVEQYPTLSGLHHRFRTNRLSCYPGRPRHFLLARLQELSSGTCSAVAPYSNRV